MDRAAQARVAAAQLIRDGKRQSAQAERKARAHRLIQQGVLFDLAGLEQRSRGELLGVQRDGGFAEKVAVPARALMRLPSARSRVEGMRFALRSPGEYSGEGRIGKSTPVGA